MPTCPDCKRKLPTKGGVARHRSRLHGIRGKEWRRATTVAGRKAAAEQRKADRQPFERPNKIIKAWAAGIIDGEGCIQAQQSYFVNGNRKNRRRASVSVVVGMTDYDVIAKLRRFFGGTVRMKNPGPMTTKQLYLWTVYGDLARNALRAFLPYLCERRKQKAIEALAVT